MTGLTRPQAESVAIVYRPTGQAAPYGKDVPTVIRQRGLFRVRAVGVSVGKMPLAPRPSDLRCDGCVHELSHVHVALRSRGVEEEVGA